MFNRESIAPSGLDRTNHNHETIILAPDQVFSTLRRLRKSGVEVVVKYRKVMVGSGERQVWQYAQVVIAYPQSVLLNNEITFDGIKSTSTLTARDIESSSPCQGQCKQYYYEVALTNDREVADKSFSYES